MTLNTAHLESEYPMVNLPKTPRMYTLFLKGYDKTHGTSLVREIEMLVDSICKIPGHSAQFWTDCQLYGLREALLYLIQSYPEANIDKIVEIGKIMLEVPSWSKVETSVEDPERFE